MHVNSNKGHGYLQYINLKEITPPNGFTLLTGFVQKLMNLVNSN